MVTLKEQRPARETPGTERRSFLNWLLAGAIISLVGATLYPIARYLYPRKVKAGQADWLEVASLSELPVGGGKLVKYGREPVWVIHPSEGDYRALSAVCTHLGCIIKWNVEYPEGHRGHFYCYCHAGVFDSLGNVLSGPPPKPLPSYQVRVSGGKVHVKA